MAGKHCPVQIAIKGTNDPTLMAAYHSFVIHLTELLIQQSPKLDHIPIDVVWKREEKLEH